MAQIKTNLYNSCLYKCDIPKDGKKGNPPKEEKKSDLPKEEKKKDFSKLIGEYMEKRPKSVTGLGRLKYVNNNINLDKYRYESKSGEPKKKLY